MLDSIITILAAACASYSGTAIVKSNVWLDQGTRRKTLYTVAFALAQVATILLKLAEGKLNDGDIQTVVAITVSGLVSWLMAHGFHKLTKAGRP